ncbi:hypothetical protein C8R45DRAFT_991161 [Mycena sanguinolenta]|nr:hypothetical protein C8R45DRAFT_991161 [Mycena sanguinolenta]
MDFCFGTLGAAWRFASSSLVLLVVYSTLPLASFVPLDQVPEHSILISSGFPSLPSLPVSGTVCTSFEGSEMRRKARFFETVAAVLEILQSSPLRDLGNGGVW